MYAVVSVGGKQYKVSEGQVFDVERMNANVGDKVNLEVLMLVDGEVVKAGKEASNSEVVAEVLGHGKDAKILVFKYKAKKHTKKQQGHRQPFTTLKVVSVK
jgi:large subunit ribosomal protein L21